MCNGGVGWEPIVRQAAEANETYVLRLLRASKDDLFHGSKWPDDPVEKVARESDVVRAACALLGGRCAIHAGVKRRIDEEV